MVLFKTPSTKVDVPNSFTYLDLTPIFEWDVVRCDLKNGHQKKHVPKMYCTPCSKYDNHSKFNNQHNLGEGAYMTIK